MSFALLRTHPTPSSLRAPADAPISHLAMPLPFCALPYLAGLSIVLFPLSENVTDFLSKLLATLCLSPFRPSPFQGKTVFFILFFMSFITVDEICYM